MTKNLDDETADGGQTIGAAGTVERILAAAAESFADRGYAASTVGDITSAAQVSRGLLFFHFGSKEGLLDAVVNRAHEDVTRIFEEVERARGIVALRKYLDARLEFFTKRPQIAKLLIALSTDATANKRTLGLFREFQNRRVELFTRCMREAIEDGDLRPDVEPTGFALLIAAATDGDVRMWTADPARRSIEQNQLAMLRTIEMLAPRT